MATLTPLAATLIAVTLLTASTARAAGETQIVAVHVDNHAQVSSRVLGDAMRFVNRVYAAAGIQVVWFDGAMQPGPAAGPLRHFRVLLLSRKMTDATSGTVQVDANVLGQAHHAVAMAYVFFSRLETIAVGKRVYIGDLVGKVIAHELGHLLLTTGHSNSGIMRPGLELRPISKEHFTVEEAAALRRRLSSAR